MAAGLRRRGRRTANLPLPPVMPPRKRSTRRAPAAVTRPDRDLERAYSPRQFAAKLRRLADALEAGRGFSIQVAGELLRIPAGATFNVEHERAGDAEELEFQLRWRSGGGAGGRRRS